MQTFYHFTSKYDLPSIKKDGLLTADRSGWHKEKDSIYLAKSPEEAKEWKYIKWNGGEPDTTNDNSFVVLEIKIPDNFNRIETLDTGEIISTADIPAEWIVRVIELNQINEMKTLLKKILKEYELPEPSRWRYWSYEIEATDWDFDLECAWDIKEKVFTDWVYEFYDDYDEEDIRQSLEADGLLTWGEDVRWQDADTILVHHVDGCPVGELRKES